MNGKILGFKLEESGRSIFAGFNECSMTLIFTKNPEERERDLEVSLSGLNLESDESAEWINKEFIVQVKESVPISPYRVKEKPVPYQEILEKMSEEEKLEMKLRQFKYLEKKLKFKGLI
jgi:hypothetical protein